MNTKIEQFPAKNLCPVLSVAKDGTVLYSNEAGKPLLFEWGIEVGEKLPSSIGDVVQKVIFQNSPEKIEVKAGNIVYLVMLYLLPEQEFVNISGFDISDQKEFEEKLQESERRYHLLFENMLDGFAYCKLLYDDCGHPVDFIYLDTNRAFEQLTGLKKVNGKRATEVVPGIKESHAELLEIYGRVALTGKPEKFEIEFKPLGIWLSISVYSTEREHFVAVFDNITERKRAERALRESEAKYRIVANNTSDWEFWLDLDGCFLYTSPSCEQVTGYAAREFMDKPDLLQEIIYPDDRQAFLQHQHDMPSSRHGDIEFRIVTKDGEIRWIHHLCQPLYDGEGCYSGSRGSNRDINERKRAEEKARLNESRLVEAQRLAKVGSWEWDVVKDVIVWSEQMYMILGRSPELQPPRYTEHPPYFTPESWTFLDSVVKKALEFGEPYELELEYIQEDGIHGWLIARGEAVLDNSEHIIRLRGTVQDITERKRAEEELKRALETLRISEDQFRGLVQNVKSGVALIDETGRFAVVNPSFVQMFGLGNELDILNVNSQDWSQWEVYGEDGKLLHVDDHPVRKAVRTGKPVKGQLVAVQNPGANELTWMLISAEPVLKEDGHIYRVICTYHDITERKRAEQALKKAHGTLEEKITERTAELQEAYNLLKESEERLADAQKIAHVGSYDWNIATNEEYWSDELYHIFGFDPQFELNHNAFLNRIHPEDLDCVNNAIKEALNGKQYYIGYRIILPDGEERVIYSQGGVIFDEKNTPIRMRGIVQDITERKKAEKALANIEIARKKEIHHRIKNNLQVISSLLDLQAEQFKNKKDIKDSEILKAFRESQDRVTSMALIHEELHECEGADTVSFSLYLEKLVDNLFKTYSLRKTDITLSMDLEENLFFDMDTAVPLGMIVNELVSNSLKYAFIGRDKGRIQIKLLIEKDGEYKKEGDKDTSFVMTVSDNGIGISENIDIENIDSLGIQLINALVDQLDGKLELKRDNGTVFTIKFAVAEE